MQNTLDWLIGTDAGTITWWQMTLRACVIFFYGLTLLRLGAIRAFGQSNSFDVVLVVALGSTLSRALTGNAKLLPTLAATTALVLLHTLLAKAAWRSKAVGRVIKGGETKLLENGEIDWEAMRKTRTTKDDLLEALRLKGIGDLSKVNAAYTALVLLHTLLAKAAWRSKAVGRVIKGGETKLLENGEIDWEAMRKTRTTKDDLLEALRLKGIGDLSKVNAAYLERSGHISVIVER